MSRFSKSLYSPHPPQRVFEVVNDVRAYPEFVPTCVSAEVLHSDDSSLTASLGFSIGLKTLHFTTHNTLNPYESIDMRLVEGPFRRLEGHWRFSPQGNGTQIDCQIDYEFASKSMSLLFSLAFPKILNYLIISFLDRAKL